MWWTAWFRQPFSIVRGDRGDVGYLLFPLSRLISLRTLAAKLLVQESVGQGIKDNANKKYDLDMQTYLCKHVCMHVNDRGRRA